MVILFCGQATADRHVTPHIFETREEAQALVERVGLDEVGVTKTQNCSHRNSHCNSGDS